MTLLERDRQNFEDGQLVGLEEGLGRGKLEVAKSMKQKGFLDELIAEVTGLTLEAVEAL